MARTRAAAKDRVYWAARVLIQEAPPVIGIPDETRVPIKLRNLMNLRDAIEEVQATYRRGRSDG